MNLESISNSHKSIELKESELERWEFPDEITANETVHHPLIAPLNSNYQILVGEDNETP